jgi:ubiquinol oxidase
MYGMYHSFNFITGYKADNPSVKSIEWRLIILESVAGVPGFVAAGFRHFRSLRTLQRDHGYVFV